MAPIDHFYDELFDSIDEFNIFNGWHRVVFDKKYDGVEVAKWALESGMSPPDCKIFDTIAFFRNEQDFLLAQLRWS